MWYAPKPTACSEPKSDHVKRAHTHASGNAHSTQTTKLTQTRSIEASKEKSLRETLLALVPRISPILGDVHSMKVDEIINNSIILKSKQKILKDAQGNPACIERYTPHALEEREYDLTIHDPPNAFREISQAIISTLLRGDSNTLDLHSATETLWQLINIDESFFHPQVVDSAFITAIRWASAIQLRGLPLDATNRNQLEQLVLNSQDERLKGLAASALVAHSTGDSFVQDWLMTGPSQGAREAVLCELAMRKTLIEFPPNANTTVVESPSGN